MAYNTIDILIALILALFVYLGIRRGFLAGAAEVAGMVVAFLFAVRGYALVSEWLTQHVGFPRILVNFSALMGLFIVGEWMFGLAVTPLLRLTYRLMPRPLRWLEALGGAVPGLVKGLLLAGALVTFLALFPINEGIRTQVQSAALAGRLANAAAEAAPRLEALFGGSAHETALFITQPSEAEAPRKMSFPSGLPTREDTTAEQRMLELVNQERTANGLPVLVADQRLRSVAIAHSQDMFKRSYFAHESPDGDTPADRLRKDRIPFLAMGENLAYAPTVEVAHTGLMNSPGHRRNILSPQFGHVGIGVVDGGIYGKMFSQEFTN